MHSTFTFTFTSASGLLLTFPLAMASPQWSGGGYGGGSSFGSPDSSNNAAGANSNSDSLSSDATNFAFSSLLQTNKAIIAHAVLASLAWAFFFPLGAILLRLNINHPIMLKLHIFLQIFSYATYLVAVGLGIWIARQYDNYLDIWSDPHPIIGLLIFAVATIQPVLGWVHHRIYKARATSSAGPRPGRTVWGRCHLWLGRILITLGVVNGGLGLKLMEGSPMQDGALTRNAEIGYGVAAGLVWLLYVLVTVVWEVGRKARERKAEQVGSSRRRRSKGQSQSSSGSSFRSKRKLEL